MITCVCVQAVAGTLPPGRVKWTANISKDTEDTKEKKLPNRACGNARDGATERTRGKQRNNETPMACTPGQIMERMHTHNYLQIMPRSLEF